jgi:hypothetical protein
MGIFRGKLFRKNIPRKFPRTTEQSSEKSAAGTRLTSFNIRVTGCVREKIAQNVAQSVLLVIINT